MKISVSNRSKWLNSSPSTPNLAASPNSQQRPVSTEKQKCMFFFKNFSSFNLTTQAIPVQCGNFRNDSTASLGSISSVDLTSHNHSVSPKVKERNHSNLNHLRRLGQLVGASASSPDVRTVGCDAVDLEARVARANSFQPADSCIFFTETINDTVAKVDHMPRSDSLFALNNRSWSSRTSVSSFKKIGKTLLNAAKASGSLLRPQVNATSTSCDMRQHYNNSLASPMNSQHQNVISSSGCKYGPLLTVPPSTALSSVRRSSMCIPSGQVPNNARTPASDGTKTDNTVTGLDTKSVSTSTSSVNEMLYTTRLSAPYAKETIPSSEESNMKVIDNDPTYGQLLKMVDVLSCTVQDLSNKMMLMMEYKDTAVSKAYPHRSKDLKEAKNHSFNSGARHSRISTKGSCSPRHRRKALPHPPSEAPPCAPDNLHSPKSTVPQPSPLMPGLLSKAADTVPLLNPSGPSQPPTSVLSLSNVITSMETDSEEEPQTCVSLALEIQHELQACRSSLTTLLSPVMSQFLSLPTPMQKDSPLSSVNFTECSGALPSSDKGDTGTIISSNASSLRKSLELPHARRSSRIHMSGDLEPSVEPHALPEHQLSPKEQVSAVDSDKGLCHSFAKAQNDPSHALVCNSSRAVQEKNSAHDSIVDSTSSSAKLNATYSSDLAHFLELLDSRLTLLERDWPHFLQLHLVRDESIGLLEHKTGQPLEPHSPTSMAQVYGQHLDSTMPEVHSSLEVSGPQLDQVWNRQQRIDQDLRSLVCRLEGLPVGQQQRRQFFSDQTCDYSTNRPGSTELLNQTQEEILEGSGPNVETNLLCTTTANFDAMNTTHHLGWTTISNQETQSLVREIEELRQRVLQWDSVHVPEWNAMYNELHEEILRLKYSDLTD